MSLLGKVAFQQAQKKMEPPKIKYKVGVDLNDDVEMNLYFV